MWPLPNPLSLFGDAVGGAVGWAWDKVVAGIYTWFASGVFLLMEWVWGVIDTASTPRLTEDWFANGLVKPIAAIALAITVALMLASAIQAGFGGRPELIVDALKEGPKSIVATSVTLVVMDVLIRMADVLAGVAWQAGREDTQQVIDVLAETMASASILGGTFLGPLAMLFGMLGLMVTAVVMFMRSALLYLVAAFSPIVWASSVSPIMRGAGRKLVQVTVALVLAKPAIAITLTVGSKLVVNAGTPGVSGDATDGAAALGTLVIGFSCFAIAGLSPWVVYRLLPTVEQAAVSSGIVSGWGRSGMTAAQVGMMAKSGAASAATRAVPAAAASAAGSGAASGGQGAASSGSSSAGAASPASAGGQAATSRRPSVPPASAMQANKSTPPGGSAAGATNRSD